MTVTKKVFDDGRFEPGRVSLKVFLEIPVPLGNQLPLQVVEDFLEPEDVAHGFAGIAVSGEKRAVESASSVFLEDGSPRKRAKGREGSPNRALEADPAEDA